MTERNAPTRGFVTVATGQEKYFRMARTLLRSYRLTAREPLPFAVLTDRRNRYTEEFDDVVLLEDATRTYVDKLKLLVRAPYDETILVDADCIAFGDLNRYWALFRDASDFSAFGAVFPLESGRGWFTREGAGKYRDQIRYGLHVHGGVYFIRRGERCRKLYGVARDIADHYGDFQFAMFRQPADEPILALAMAAEGFRPVDEGLGEFVWFVRAGTLRADFFTRTLLQAPAGSDALRPRLLLHFSTGLTIHPLYLLEARKVDYLHRRGRAWSARTDRRVRALCRAQNLALRARRKLARLLGQKRRS